MFAALAKLLGLPPERAEEALYSEPLAKAYLNRRVFLAGSGALLLCSGKFFSFASRKPPLVARRVVFPLFEIASCSEIPIALIKERRFDMAEYTPFLTLEQDPFRHLDLGLQNVFRGLE